MRPLTRADAPACSALHKACDLEEAWSEAAYEELIENNLGYGCFSSQMLGFIIFQKADTQGDIIYIAVSPHARNQGIGRNLIDRVMEEYGVNTLFLEVNEINQGALAFYKAIGFIQVGRRSGYYVVKRKKYDAVILKRCN
jgi:ribosomal-protein-alanine N-acetyltransferase